MTTPGQTDRHWRVPFKRGAPSRAEWAGCQRTPGWICGYAVHRGARAGEPGKDRGWDGWMQAEMAQLQLPSE